MKIAICDDEEIFRQHLEQIISSFLGTRKIPYEIDLFRSGEEFVELNLDMEKYQVVFLDINMDKLDGISTARRLRERCKDTFVVFVTAFINYALDGYEVDAIRYILKNAVNFEKSVNECMETILERMHYTDKLHKFVFKEGTIEVNENSIVYIESNLHELYFSIMKKDFSVWRMDESLNCIERILDAAKFVRIHQSYLVNMKYVKSMKAQKAILLGGKELPIAKPRYKEVRGKFAAYKGEL